MLVKVADSRFAAHAPPVLRSKNRWVKRPILFYSIHLQILCFADSSLLTRHRSTAMPFSRYLTLLLVLGLAACSGQVRTLPLDATALKSANGTKGVIVYQPALFKLTYRFTVRVDKDGKVSEGRCQEAVQKEEFSILPDFSQPLVVRNASGWFSAAKFSATISNGMLASLNAEPTQKPSELLTATNTLVSTLMPAFTPQDGTLLCNASPILAVVERARLP